MGKIFKEWLVFEQARERNLKKGRDFRIKNEKRFLI